MLSQKLWISVLGGCLLCVRHAAWVSLSTGIGIGVAIGAALATTVLLTANTIVKVVQKFCKKGKINFYLL